MPTDLQAEILKVLQTMTSADRPATFNDLARRFGVGAPLIAALARQLVDKGLAQPSYVDIRGTRTLFALEPQPPA
jgi:hypothetical protein